MQRIANRLKKQRAAGPIAAGLAVVANDTGRVLMIQRPLSDDPNSGKWEFPGGRLGPEELPLAGAFREWGEETGLVWPDNEAEPVRGVSWKSSDGKYVGFVAHVPSESTFDLNDRDLFSDPDSEVGGVIAWVHPRDLPRHNLRPALLNDVDEVMARITKWLLGQVRKSGPINRLKASLFETDTEKGVGDSLQSAGRWLAAKWQQLEERYGRKTALAMAVAMLGTILVPGSVPAVIAVAEGIRGVSGYFQRECGGEVEKLGKEAVDLKSCCVFPKDRLKGGGR